MLTLYPVINIFSPPKSIAPLPEIFSPETFIIPGADHSILP
jgi:hypothetical protein